MSNLRLIARLDIKAPNLIKGIHLEGFRVIGDPNFYARRYYEAGADEFIYMDVVASLYERNSLVEIVEKTTKNVFVPLNRGRWRAVGQRRPNAFTPRRGQGRNQHCRDQET